MGKATFLAAKRAQNSIEDGDYPARRHPARRESDKDNERSRRAQLLWSFLVALGVSGSAVYETSIIQRELPRKPVPLAQRQPATNPFPGEAAGTEAQRSLPGSIQDVQASEVGPKKDQEKTEPLQFEPVTE